MTGEIKELFNALVKEMNRQQMKSSQKFDEVKLEIQNAKEESRQHYEQLSHEINSCKLNIDAVGFLIQKIDELERRIAELEKKTA